MQRTFDHNFDLVFNACLLALKELGMKIEYNSKNSGDISAKTEISIFSWGETLDVKVLKNSTSSTTVKIKSTSNAQLIDWGKNEDNELKILNKVNEVLNR